MIEGWKIREWRERAGITLAGMADACGMRQQFLESIEADKVPRVHTRTYLKISDHLGISIDQLATDPDEKPSDQDFLTSELPVLRPLYATILGLVLGLGTVCLFLLVVAVCFGIVLAIGRLGLWLKLGAVLDSVWLGL